MPVLFIGHGSPMNAIEENEFVKGMEEYRQNSPETKCNFMCFGTLGNKGNTGNCDGETRHHSRFGGFPKALFDVQYPAPGSPELAKKQKHH